MIRVLRETHEAPEGVQERVTRAGGYNRFDEPNFRVVWGGSRLTWIGGRWTDHDTDGNRIGEVFELRRVPKYLPIERWHIEQWMPPEFYGTPSQWYERTIETESGVSIPALGPYPSRGEYEHCWTLACGGGEFLALTPTVCDWVVRAIEWSKRQPRAVRREALRVRETRLQADWDRTADDLLDDAVPAFHAAPFVAGIDMVTSI